MLTTTDAAKLLGVSRARVITLIHLGTLVATKHGRDWQVDPQSVEAYKNSPRKAGRKPHDTRFSSSLSNTSEDRKSDDFSRSVAPMVAPAPAEGGSGGAVRRKRGIQKR